jgi:hypothetical protein
MKHMGKYKRIERGEQKARYTWKKERVIVRKG